MAVPPASSLLSEGGVYTRTKLGELMGYGEKALQRGLFTPRRFSSVFIFITKNKSKDMTQYEDDLDGDDLHFDSETAGQLDFKVIQQKKLGLELLLFYREHKSEHPHGGFRFVGRFDYVSHIPGEPNRFHLRRVGAKPPTKAPADDWTPGAPHRVFEDGVPLDATFHVDRLGDQCSVVIEARGGSGANKFNSEYAAGLTWLLKRLGENGATLADIYLDTRAVAHRPLEDRRINLAYPVDPRRWNPEALRLTITRQAGRLCRKRGATGGGNTTRRLRLVLSKAPQSPSDLANLLALPADAGASPTAPPPLTPPPAAPPTGPAPRTFALLANAQVYDVESAARSLQLGTWLWPKGNVRVGDEFLIWRTHRDDARRGFVGLGRVVTEPSEIRPHASELRFWTDPVAADVEARRFRFEFIDLPGLPLWLDEDDGDVLKSLTVSRGQGNRRGAGQVCRRFSVSEDQRTRILEAAAQNAGRPAYKPQSAAEQPSISTESAPQVPTDTPVAASAFALLANASVYDVEAAAQNLRYATWSLPRGRAHPGERFLIWRTLGPDKQRGLVAMGQVVDEPTLLRPYPAELRYWSDPVAANVVARRFDFEFLDLPGLPLWLQKDGGGVLSSLSVSRGQGNRRYSVSEDQWARILALAELEASRPASGSIPAEAPPQVEVASSVHEPPPEALVAAEPAPSPTRPAPRRSAAPEMEELADRFLAHLREFGSLTQKDAERMAKTGRRYRRLIGHLEKMKAPIQGEYTLLGTVWRLKEPYR